jgi:hypothetical protein
MNKTLIAALALGLAAACGGSSSPNNSCTVDSDCATNSAGKYCDASVCGAAPVAPTIGSSEVDRMGRAGVNTALTDPFDLDSAMTEDAHKDAYNANAISSTWATSFSTEIRGNLGILDGLDNTCGNQLGADTTKTDATRYNTLAGVLADDELYVNTASNTCAIYLGVEADAVHLASGNGDCGGRTPLENSIDSTYQVLVAGTICALQPSVCAIANGIASDTDATASITAFPFLTAPN